MNTTPFPPNSDSAYVAATAPQGKTIVTAQYVPGVGFATVIETADGKLLEARYPITSADHIREITREDFEARYQQPIDLLNPKFGYMQQIRDNVTGDVLTVIGLPGDNMIVGETLEPAYVCATAAMTAWNYNDIHPKKIISQKKVERVGAFTLVEESVGKGDNPKIEHKEVPSRARVLIGISEPGESSDSLANAINALSTASFNRTQPTSDGSEGTSKARGMNPSVIHIDEDCSGNGKPIGQLLAELSDSDHRPMGTVEMTRVGMDVVCAPGIAAGDTRVINPEPKNYDLGIVDGQRHFSVKLDETIANAPEAVSQMINNIVDRRNGGSPAAHAFVQPIVADDQSAY